MCRTTGHGYLQARRAIDRDGVFAFRFQTYGGCGRVDDVGASRGVREADDDAPPGQAQMFVREHFEFGVLSEMEQCAVAEDDLGAAVVRAHDVARDEHQGRIRALGDAVLDDIDRAVDIGQVRRCMCRCRVRGLLRVRRKCDQARDKRCR
jgi:hypothetical protein